MSAPKIHWRLRFEQKIQKTATCWLWKATVCKRTGYGSFRVDGRNGGAHRAAYMFWVGPITKGLSVLHTCDVRHCVNPFHLFLGTPQDNATDMVSKNRQGGGRPFVPRSHAYILMCDERARKATRDYKARQKALHGN